MKSIINDIFNENINKIVKQQREKGKTDDEIDKIFSSQEFIKANIKSIDEISKTMVKTLSKNMKSKIIKDRKNTKRYLLRHQKLWVDGLETFKAMYDIAIESAQIYCQYVDELDESKKIESIYLFLSLREIHGRACQVFLEILCLMENGFADGAYARWRTLYELSVYSAFIFENGENVAKSYYESSDNQRDSGEWVRVANCFKNNKSRRISFTKVQKNCNLIKEWKKEYNLSSQIVHATPQGTFKRISNYEISDDNEGGIPVGHSNYGLSTPAEHSAISLAITSRFFLSIFYNYESLVNASIMDKWIDKVRYSFFKVNYEYFNEETHKEWLDSYLARGNN